MQREKGGSWGGNSEPHPHNLNEASCIKVRGNQVLKRQNNKIATIIEVLKFAPFDDFYPYPHCQESWGPSLFDGWALSPSSEPSSSSISTQPSSKGEDLESSINERKIELTLSFRVRDEVQLRSKFLLNGESFRESTGPEGQQDLLVEDRRLRARHIKYRRKHPQLQTPPPPPKDSNPALNLAQAVGPVTISRTRWDEK